MNANTSGAATEISVKNASRWDPERYYNIWIVNKIDGFTSTFCGCACDAGIIAGYAYFLMANNTRQANMNLDGTLMLAGQMKAGEKKLPHEIGHALNLQHPFYGSNSSTCPVNTSPTADGDLCADTDPINNPQIDANPFSCRTGTNPCTSTNFNDNTEKITSIIQVVILCLHITKSTHAGICYYNATGRSGYFRANNQAIYPATFVAPISAAAAPSCLNGGSNIS